MSAYLDDQQRQPFSPPGPPSRQWTGFDQTLLSGSAEYSVAFGKIGDLSRWQERLSQEQERLSQELQKVRATLAAFVKLNFIGEKRLRTALDVVVEPDEGGFIARTIDIPLYGYGDDPSEAIDMLKSELAGLLKDLEENDSFSDKWLVMKAFFKELIAE